MGVVDGAVDRAFAMVLCGVMLTGAAAAGTAPAAPLPPHDAGARVGQALGSALVCPGLKLTRKAEELAGAYTGADLKTFEDKSRQILGLWQKTLGCDTRFGPDQCRIINEKSCLEARREIGPEGSALPGLVEVVK